MLIKSKFPEYNSKFDFDSEENALEYIKVVISSIRNRRAELNVPKDKKPDIFIATTDETIKSTYEMCSGFIRMLALVKEIKFVTNMQDIDKYIILTFDKSTIYIPSDELVDVEKEKARIEAEIKRIEFEISRAKGMLSNENFVKKAPEQKINDEKEKLKKYEQMLIELNSTLEKL